MNKSKNNSFVQAAIASVLPQSPIINVLSFDLAGEGRARVVCSVSHAGNSREDHSSVIKALRAKFNGKMEAVAGSFSHLSKGKYQDEITGIMAVVRESMPLNPEGMTGFKAVASNMFMDEEEHMWVVRKSAAGDLVVKTTGIDDDLSLISLMREACSSAAASVANSASMKKLVAQASAVSSAVKGGDFITYINANNELTAGFAVALCNDEAKPDVKQVLVLPTDGDEELVHANAIVDIHDESELPEHQETDSERVDAAVASARGEVSLQMMLDYYKRVFARSPAYYKEFAARLKQHAFA
jgi:hypothetical protein